MKSALLSGFLAAALTFATGASAQEKRVVVYTAHNTNIINALQPRFEKETGIKIDLVKAGSGDIIKRVRAVASSP